MIARLPEDDEGVRRELQDHLTAELDDERRELRMWSWVFWLLRLVVIAGLVWLAIRFLG
jgi:hypothetical protein